MTFCVVSFTTSPSRISNIKPMVDSILNQTRRPDLFLLNIPKVFPKTGEKYIIPSFLEGNVTINYIEEDLGPATKIIPTISYLKSNNINLDETRIVYLDDDIRYMPGMIKTFLYYSNNENNILCGSTIHCRSLQKNALPNIWYPIRNHLQIAHVAEGYGAVCLSPKIFKNDFWDYFDTIKNNKDKPFYREAFFSDDVVLSNYYTKHNYKIITIAVKEFNILYMWNNNCILDYGNDEDALHVNHANSRKYPRTLSLFKRLGILYIQPYVFSSTEAGHIRLSKMRISNFKTSVIWDNNDKGNYRFNM